jgi:hypothetical protein
MKITTIKIHKETKERLDKLKENPRETYEDILKKILFILNTSRKDPERAKFLMNKIDLSIKNNKEYTEVSHKDKSKENNKQ